MSNISHDLTGKIDPKSVSVLLEIDKITGQLEIPFFVVGATARDFLLDAAYDIRPPMATMDIDIAVSVSDWQQYAALESALVATGKFNRTKEFQRLMFADELPVDLVPFGGIGDAKNSISWPPDGNVELSVQGFRECCEGAIDVLVSGNPRLIVKVVTLAGLAILKLVAWNDSREKRGRDVLDVFWIIKHYVKAGNWDRYADDSETLEEEEFEYERYSARLLGRDMAGIADPATKNLLIHLLASQKKLSDEHRIATDVLRQGRNLNLTYENVVRCFDALVRGLMD